MPQMTSYDQGVPSWIDIGVPDHRQGRRLLRPAVRVGGARGRAEATGFYRQAELQGQPVAGIGPQQDPNMPPFWTTYVNVASADDAAAKVAAAGGTVIVAPMDVMDFGRDGRVHRPDRRGVQRVAAGHPQRRRPGQRAGHAVVERADLDRHRGRQGVLRRRVRLGGQDRRRRARSPTPSSRSAAGPSPAACPRAP